MRKELQKKHSKVIRAIASSISKDEIGIKELLKRNGVDATLIKTKKDLSNVFVNALAKSKGLGLDFHKYVLTKLEEEGYVKSKGYGSEIQKLNTHKEGFANADGLDPFRPIDNSGLYDFTNITVGGGYDNTNLNPTSSTSSNDTPATELQGTSRFFDGMNIMDLLNMGMGVLEVQRDMKVSSDNQKAISDATNYEITKTSSQAKEPNKSNMTTYIVLGTFGVALLGGIIYFITKKKK